MRETTVEQLASALDQGAAVVDVREPAEFRQGHVPRARNIPMAELLPGSARSTATARCTWCAPRATAAAR